MYCKLYCALFLLFVFKRCQSLASGGVYLIQNQGTKKCISMGPVSNKNTTLFKEGEAISKPCYNSSSVDFTHQHWLVKIKKEDPRNLTFDVELLMENNSYNDTALKAVLNGEFVSYFPNPIKLKGSGLSGNETTQSHQFFIVNPATHQCLTDQKGDETKLKFMNCSSNHGGSEIVFQKWNFTIANDKEMVRQQLELFKNITASLAAASHQQNKQN